MNPNPTTNECLNECNRHRSSTIAMDVARYGARIVVVHRVRRDRTRSHVKTNANATNDRRSMTTSKRSMMMTMMMTMTMTMTMTMDDPEVANAMSIMDELSSRKRRTNASFALGPMALMRARLSALRAALDDESPSTQGDGGALNDALARATLDCVDARQALKPYAAIRDVCTLAIVARGATEGPGARHDEASAEARGEREALTDARRALDELARVVTGEKANVDARGKAFDDVDDALVALANATLRCFRLDASERAEVEANARGALARRQDDA